MGIQNSNFMNTPNDSNSSAVNVSSPVKVLSKDNPDLPSDIGFHISAFDSFVDNIDIQKGILQRRYLLERIDRILLKKN